VSGGDGWFKDVRRPSAEVVALGQRLRIDWAIASAGPVFEGPIAYCERHGMVWFSACPLCVDERRERRGGP
jgi:hypothetical protein